jgi:3-hydroxyisobutyrate dehydrogenase-like beta-hydroxyacid dehydrogenase
MAQGRGAAMTTRADRRPFVAWLGLGQLGAPLCARAARAYRVLGVDPAVNGVPGLWSAAGSVSELAARDPQPWAIVLCLPSTESFLTAIEELCSTPTLVRGARALVNLSTVGPRATAQAQQALSAAAPDLQYVESLVTGGVLRAKDGQVTLLVSSRSAIPAELRALLEALADRQEYLDSVHEVTVAKLVNNVAMLGAASSTLEALDLGISNGLSKATLFRVLKGGTGASYILDNSLSRAFLTGDTRTGYAARLALKDARLALELGATVECPMPHTGVVCDELTQLVGSGGGDRSFAMIGGLRGIPAGPATEAQAFPTAGGLS